MTDDPAVTAALDEVRGLVSADGGDVELEGVDGARYELRLVLENAHCVECVMPRTFLEQVALDVFQRNGVNADAVAIDDPREHPDFVMPDS
jgi:Fe-S cluster biogenesis protein NfuA